MTERYIERNPPLPPSHLQPHTPRQKGLVAKIEAALERGHAEQMTTGTLALWIWQIVRSNGRDKVEPTSEA